MKEHHVVALGAIIMFLSVAAGAFGAHGVKSLLSTELFAVYETAVRYQAYHGLAILVVGVSMAVPMKINLRRAVVSVYSFLFGTVLFSGSLYLYVFTEVKAFGMVTPVGGLLFLVGWLVLVVSVKPPNRAKAPN